MMRVSTSECVSLCDGNAIRGSMGSSTISVTHIHHRCHHRHCCHHHYHHITSHQQEWQELQRKELKHFLKLRCVWKCFQILASKPLKGEDSLGNSANFWRLTKYFWRFSEETEAVSVLNGNIFSFSFSLECTREKLCKWTVQHKIQNVAAMKWTVNDPIWKTRLTISWTNVRCSLKCQRRAQ